MTRRVSATAILLAALLALFAGRARADENAGLRQGWSLYHQGQLQAARRAAEQLLMRGDRSNEERRDAYLLLGAIAWLGGDAWAAEDRIIDALSYDPDYQPDPLHLSPELQKLVRRVARDRRSEVTRRAAARRAAPHSQPTAATRPASSRKTALTQVPAGADKVGLPPSRIARATPLYLAPLPFGVGQFLNGHRRKAWALLVSETALAATSIACLSAALALRDRRGRYPEDVIGSARALNGIYLGSAYSALALMIYGAIDGLVYRRAAETPTHTVLLPAPSGSIGAGLQRSF